MSTYEKIASVLIGILIVLMVIFSYREIKESAGLGGIWDSDFDKSIGQDFTIGPYATVVSEHSSGGREDGCDALRPVIIGTLHDIKERLEHMKTYNGTEDVFEVNEPTLQLLCNKNATITLSDGKGSTLVLEKIPFVRALPPQGEPGDIGTDVRINATVVPAGKPLPTQITTFGEQLIPDRYLDNATSSPF